VAFLVMLAAEAALLGGAGFTRWYSALSRRTAAAPRA
jgi:hypothetical protein